MNGRVIGFVYRPQNRPFPSAKKSHFQHKAKCETFVVKMSFICIIIKNHFHINSFALSLTFKVRFFGTRKWPILIQLCKATFSALRSTVLQVDISRFVHVLFLIFQLPFDCSLYSSVSCSFSLRQFTVTRSVKCSSTCHCMTRPASYHKIYSPYHYFS